MLTFRCKVAAILCPEKVSGLPVGRARAAFGGVVSFALLHNLKELKLEKDDERGDQTTVGDYGPAWEPDC